MRKEYVFDPRPNRFNLPTVRISTLEPDGTRVSVYWIWSNRNQNRRVVTVRTLCSM